MPAPLEDTVFAERQRFWLNPVLRVLLPLEAVVLSALLGAVGSAKPPDQQLLFVGVWLGLCVALPAALLASSLRTRITPTRLTVRLAVLRARSFELAQIASAESVRYSFSDTNGWGIRYSKKFGRVYNIAGDRGVALTTHQGHRFLIGSQRPDELLAAIHAGMPRGS